MSVGTTRPPAHYVSGAGLASVGSAELVLSAESLVDGRAQPQQLGTGQHVDVRVTGQAEADLVGGPHELDPELVVTVAELGALVEFASSTVSQSAGQVGGACLPADMVSTGQLACPRRPVGLRV